MGERNVRSGQFHTARQTSDKPVRTRTVPDAQELKIGGIVIKRDPDSFTLREPDHRDGCCSKRGTSVKTVRKGCSGQTNRPGELHPARASAKGRWPGQPGKVNWWRREIRFDEDDLRTAQALEARVDPVEDMATSTKALAEANQQRIEEVEQTAQKLSGQIDELSAITAAARDATKQAQASADQAQADASMANQRIQWPGRL